MKLDEKLKSLQVPEPDSRRMDQIQQKARLAFKNAPAQGARSPGILSNLLWAGGGSLATAVILFAVLFGSETVPSSGGGLQYASNREMVDNLEVLRQYRESFPKQLRAVITQNSEADIVLSASGDTPDTQPVAIQIKRGGDEVKVLTFSGQNIVLTLNGKKFSFEVLLDGDGNILLIGEEFIWNSNKPSNHGELSIFAEELKGV